MNEKLVLIKYNLLNLLCNNEKCRKSPNLNNKLPFCFCKKILSAVKWHPEGQARFVSVFVFGIKAQQAEWWFRCHQHWYWKPSPGPDHCGQKWRSLPGGVTSKPLIVYQL